jgi:hypothetical protein
MQYQMQYQKAASTVLTLGKKLEEFLPAGIVGAGDTLLGTAGRSLILREFSAISRRCRAGRRATTGFVLVTRRPQS